MFDLDEEPGLDMTPLIDVIFMLLVFFIMTTTFSRPVLDIVLPSADTARDPRRESAEMILSIKADGTVLHEDQVLDKAELNALLGTRKEEMLNMFVDEKAPFEAFVGVVDLARKQREGRFVISTRSTQN